MMDVSAYFKFIFKIAFYCDIAGILKTLCHLFKYYCLGIFLAWVTAITTLTWFIWVLRFRFSEHGRTASGEFMTSFDDPELYMLSSGNYLRFYCKLFFWIIGVVIVGLPIYALIKGESVKSNFLNWLKLHGWIDEGKPPAKPRVRNLD